MDTESFDLDKSFVGRRLSRKGAINTFERAGTKHALENRPEDIERVKRVVCGARNITKEAALDILEALGVVKRKSN